jgi:hypothetical protein
MIFFQPQNGKVSAKDEEDEDSDEEDEKLQVCFLQPKVKQNLVGTACSNDGFYHYYDSDSYL